MVDKSEKEMNLKGIFYFLATIQFVVIVNVWIEKKCIPVID